MSVHCVVYDQSLASDLPDFGLQTRRRQDIFEQLVVKLCHTLPMVCQQKEVQALLVLPIACNAWILQQSLAPAQP